MKQCITIFKMLPNAIPDWHHYFNTFSEVLREDTVFELKDKTAEQLKDEVFLVETLT